MSINNRNSSPFGITVPNEFPVQNYLSVMERINKYKDVLNEYWEEFVGGWKSIAFKFKECNSQNTLFCESIRTNGISPAPEARYKQEINLFVFFVSGISVVERFYRSL